MRAFAERLKKLRKSMGLSQVELAEKIGVSQTAISDYEGGRKEPTAPVILKIADFFDVSADYLLGRIDHPQPWENDLPEQVKEQLRRLEELERKYKELSSEIKRLYEKLDI